MEKHVIEIVLKTTDQYKLKYLLEHLDNTLDFDMDIIQYTVEVKESVS